MGRPDIAAVDDYPARFADADSHAEVLAEAFLERTAGQWEDELQANHVPATRVRTLPEALADPQLRARGLTHDFADVLATGADLTVPVAAFKYAHGGPSIDTPPPTLGQHTDAVLREIGCAEDEIAKLREAGTI